MTQALGLPSVAALAAVGLIVVPAVEVGALRMRRHRRPLEAAQRTRVTGMIAAAAARAQTPATAYSTP